MWTRLLVILQVRWWISGKWSLGAKTWVCEMDRMVFSEDLKGLCVSGDAVFVSICSFVHRTKKLRCSGRPHG